MLTIVIKAYCVNVVVDIKPIYLGKLYFKIISTIQIKSISVLQKYIKLSKFTLSKLNQLPDQLKNTDFTQRKIKMQHVLGWSIKKCKVWLLFEMCSSSFHKPQLLVTSSKRKSVPLQCLQRTKSLISSCRRIGKTILQHLLVKPSDICCCSLLSEAATRSVLQKKVFLKSLQISQVQTCFGVSFY